MHCDPANGDGHYCTKQGSRWICIRCGAIVR